MCKSKLEGGQRCAKHLRPLYLQALQDYTNPGKDTSASKVFVISYATTPTGANEIKAKIASTTDVALVDWLTSALGEGVEQSKLNRQAIKGQRKLLKSLRREYNVDEIIEKIENAQVLTSDEANRVIAYASNEAGLNDLILISNKLEKKGYYLGSQISHMVRAGKEVLARNDRIWQACKVECIRQGVGPVELEQLEQAYHLSLEMDSREFDLEKLFKLSSIVEPNKASHIRTTPVTFANGSMGLEPGLIARALDALFTNSPSPYDRNSNMSIDEFVKEFLIIHPFQDGNGRVAFLIYNLLHHYRGYPNPLPDYFNESNSESHDSII